MRTHSIVVACGFASAIAAFAGSSHAQPFPTRPLRFVVPFPPGGSNDVMVRMLAPKMAVELGQNVVVDNRGGANSIIGSEIVAKALPDGHTILIIGGSYLINPSVYPKLPYDTARDFAPISLVGEGSNVLAAHPSFPAASVADLIALARAKPGQIAYASSGLGNLTHLAMEMFSAMAGIKMLHVPYKGGNPAILDLIGGRVAVSISTVTTAKPHLDAGRIKALGVTTATRSQVLPNVPTIAESGLSGYSVSGWYGLLAPAATPKVAITRLHSVMQNVLTQPEIREKLLSVGVDAAVSTPEQVRKRIEVELAKWNKIVKPLGIKPE